MDRHYVEEQSPKHCTFFQNCIDFQKRLKILFKWKDFFFMFKDICICCFITSDLSIFITQTCWPFDLETIFLWPLKIDWKKKLILHDNMGKSYPTKSIICFEKKKTKKKFNLFFYCPGFVSQFFVSILCLLLTFIIFIF